MVCLTLLIEESNIKPPLVLSTWTWPGPPSGERNPPPGERGPSSGESADDDLYKKKASRHQNQRGLDVSI